MVPHPESYSLVAPHPAWARTMAAPVLAALALGRASAHVRAEALGEDAGKPCAVMLGAAQQSCVDLRSLV
jgi:hypothetical protein